MVSWGVAYQDASRAAIYQPVAQRLGISIREDTLSGIADSQRQVRSGNVTWDIVEQWNNDCVTGGADGLFESLGYGVIDITGINPSLVHEHWIVGNIYYSTVLAWNTQKYGSDGPKNWAGFWDVDRFPGTRAMWNGPRQSMEIALLADGVPKERVYDVLASEQGVERAFRKLREIKPHIAAWWDSGAQAQSLLKDGAADMLMIWNGRATSAIQDGAQATFTWAQGILDYNCLTVLKGAPNRELAMRVINEMLSPMVQANILSQIDYGPVNALAFETGHISAELARTLPTAPQNVRQQLLYSAEFWAQRGEGLKQRFDAFIAE